MDLITILFESEGEINVLELASFHTEIGICQRASAVELVWDIKAQVFLAKDGQVQIRKLFGATSTM